MVLGCLKLETQSTITGLMAKHCCTASLLSMVSSHFTSVSASSSYVYVAIRWGQANEVENAEVNF